MTPVRRATATALAALTAAGAAGCGDRDHRPDRSRATIPFRVAVPLSPTPVPLPPGLRGPQGGTLALHVRRRTQLRTEPGGRVVGVVLRRTHFGSSVLLTVIRRRPGWVQVRTAVPGHPVGWIPASAGRIYRESRSIVIDLSRRLLTVYRNGRLERHFRVAVGAPGTATPTGRYGLTDRLHATAGTDYGCCIMALTARQPHLAQGWGGGDRIAIHATSETWAIGKAVSHGCVRATTAAMRILMRRIRLGASVTVHV